MQFAIPYKVRYVVNRLNEEGFSAYPVGGCVRDTLLMRRPHDWDVATNAHPDEVLEIFDDLTCVQIGKRFGTIGVSVDGETIEITTFRTESTYSDMRRPDAVCYSESLLEDLSRRDFTINAMAFDKNGEVIDCFGAAEDLKQRVIRAVGDPAKRFSEDALRIMRALRFSSELGFSIEPATREALFECSHLLKCIAPERIYAEFRRLLLGKDAPKVMREYVKILAVFIPDLLKIDIVRLRLLCDTISFLPDSFFMRIAAIYICGGIENPKDAVRDMLLSLKSEHVAVFDTVTLISAFFDTADISEIGLKKLISRYGSRHLKEALELKRCMAAARGGCVEAVKYAAAEKHVDDIVDSGACLSIDALEIDGYELERIGIEPSARMGEILRGLLDAVICGKVKNETDALLKYAKEM